MTKKNQSKAKIIYWTKHLERFISLNVLHIEGTLIKILTDINWCLTDPANQCLTDV